MQFVGVLCVVIIAGKFALADKSSFASFVLCIAILPFWLYIVHMRKDDISIINKQSKFMQFILIFHSYIAIITLVYFVLVNFNRLSSYDSGFVLFMVLYILPSMFLYLSLKDHKDKIAILAAYYKHRNAWVFDLLA